MTSNVIGNKKLNPVGTELSIKGRILNISINHLSDIEFKDLMVLYRKCTKKYPLFVTDTTFSSDNPLHG